MSHVLCRSTGGSVCLPDPRTIMIDRQDGGQLVVNPPRRVWDRTALERDELTNWNFLIAATGRAMLEALPQLEGGCLNYWDAGNWALHTDAAPAGHKVGVAHRFLHQHVIGRSPRSADPSWRWGESPFYPEFADRFRWSEGKTALTPGECVNIVARLTLALTGVYGVPSGDVTPSAACPACGYPTPLTDGVSAATSCPTCRGVNRRA